MSANKFYGRPYLQKGDFMYNNSIERLGAMFDCVPVKDRADIPIYPQLITWAGRYAGKTQKEIFADHRVYFNCVKKVFDDFGYPDAMNPADPATIVFGEGLPANYPGKQLGDDELFQFVETINIEEDDYKKIVEKGWDKWFMDYTCRIQNPPMSKFQVIKTFINMGKKGAELVKTFRPLGVEPISGSTFFPLFDQLSLIRSFGEFIMDLYDEPDMIKQILDKETPIIIKTQLKRNKKNPIKRMHVYAMRSDASVISPDIFDEFSYPYLKQMILAFHEAGFKTVLHADGKWLPMLDRFLELPKGSVHFEFDGNTDLRQAAQILDGHLSFRGDVPATMMAMGTPDEVSEYCEGLIEDVGMKTPGFMLGTGCEVPLNCKPENYKALMDSILKARK